MKLLFTIFSLFITTLAFNQAPCMPDEMFADTLGVFPPPIDTTAENPSEGIDKIACLGKPYEFVFTVAVGDSLDLGTFSVAIDSITVDPDNAIAGLPVGLSYGCSLDNCSFLKDTSGCVAISGIIDESNEIGEYPLVITATLHAQGASLEETLPGQFFPGFYSLRVEASDSEACTTSSTDEVLPSNIEMSISPNPTSSFAKLKVEVPESGIYQYRIFNMLGREVFNTPIRLNAGQSEYEFDFGFLSNGLYLYALNNDKIQLTKRLVIRK